MEGHIRAIMCIKHTPVYAQCNVKVKWEMNTASTVQVTITLPSRQRDAEAKYDFFHFLRMISLVSS